MSAKWSRADSSICVMCQCGYATLHLLDSLFGSVSLVRMGPKRYSCGRLGWRWKGWKLQVLKAHACAHFICWLISLVWRSQSCNCSAFSWTLLQLVQFLDQKCVSHLDDLSFLWWCSCHPVQKAVRTDMGLSLSSWDSTHPVGSSLSFVLFYFTVTYIGI